MTLRTFRFRGHLTFWPGSLRTTVTWPSLATAMQTAPTEAVSDELVEEEDVCFEGLGAGQVRNPLPRFGVR